MAEQKAIKTTEELLALRNDAGVIKIEGDLKIGCNVPWSAGKGISSIFVMGYADFQGDVAFGGNAVFKCNAFFRGNAAFRGKTLFQGNADFAGYAVFRGNAMFRCNAMFQGNADFAGYAAFGGNAVFKGDYLIVEGEMFWAQMHKPKLPKETHIRRVLPPPHQRDYWAERLGMELEDCYEEIDKTLVPKLGNILRDKKWTPTERWMLETLQAGNQKATP